MYDFSNTDPKKICINTFDRGTLVLKKMEGRSFDYVQREMENMQKLNALKLLNVCWSPANSL